MSKNNVTYLVSVLYNQSSKLVANLELHAIPRVGEHLWILDYQDDPNKCSSFVVTDVCYWVSTKRPTEGVCLYVKPSKNLTKEAPND